MTNPIWGLNWAKYPFVKGPALTMHTLGVARMGADLLQSFGGRSCAWVPA